MQELCTIMAVFSACPEGRRDAETCVLHLGLHSLGQLMGKSPAEYASVMQRAHADRTIKK